MNKSVLDASALLALFNSEKGASVVEVILPHSVISAVNASEVIAELYSKLNIPPKESQEMIHTVVDKIISFTADLATITASLRSKTTHLGLSLGDRACLALGLHLSAPVYTADKVWKKLDSPHQIVLIR